MSPKSANDLFSAEETAQRRDTLLLELLKRPPKPRTKKKRKPSRAKAASAKRGKRA